LVPADSKLQSTLSKKTLRIAFEDSLEKNTTYTLYLNSAVKDITEGNDSLIKFTFSTGTVIDSLSLNVRIFNAFSKEWMPKVTVGLYPNFNDESPRYFTQSQNNGLAHFDALKAGSYFVKAFVDVNQDIHCQKLEKQGFFIDPIPLELGKSDTLLLPLSLPLADDKVKNARIIPPGIIGLHFPAGMNQSQLKLNGQELGINQLIGIGEDSLLISVGERKETLLQISGEFDTLSVRNTPKQQGTRISIQFNEKEGLLDHFDFSCTDFISWIDTSKIILRNVDDSSRVNFEVDYLANRFEIRPKKHISKFNISISDDAIHGKTTNVSKPFQKEIQWKQERDFGDLRIQLNDTISAGIIQVIQKDQVVRTVVFSNLEKINLPDLLPGEYTFKIILDRNKNGKWDPISQESKTLAEEVLLFRVPVKIRANWEVETNFDIQKNEP
jgi:uncharacterized protein (DUF2141 family)